MASAGCRDASGRCWPGGGVGGPVGSARRLFIGPRPAFGERGRRVDAGSRSVERRFAVQHYRLARRARGGRILGESFIWPRIRLQAHAHARVQQRQRARSGRMQGGPAATGRSIAHSQSCGTAGPLLQHPPRFRARNSSLGAAAGSAAARSCATHPRRPPHKQLRAACPSEMCSAGADALERQLLGPATQCVQRG
jgi:hypothetical protein